MPRHQTPCLDHGAPDGIAAFQPVMKFRVDRLQFLRMIGLLTTNPPAGKNDTLVRICARGRALHVACNDEEAGCDAIVETEGVCFLRHDKLRRLLQTYHSDPRHKKGIEIEVSAEGICVGQTLLPRAGWEVSLFMDPDLAPMHLDFQLPNDPVRAHEQLEMPLDEISRSGGVHKISRG